MQYLLVCDCLQSFWKDERGSAAMDNMVLAASAVAYALAAGFDAMTAVADYSDDVALCIKRQKNTLKRDDWDYQKKLQKMGVRCGRI